MRKQRPRQGPWQNGVYVLVVGMHHVLTLTRLQTNVTDRDREHQDQSIDTHSHLKVIKVTGSLIQSNRVPLKAPFSLKGDLFHIVPLSLHVGGCSLGQSVHSGSNYFQLCRFSVSVSVKMKFFLSLSASRHSDTLT